ncbi:hypothetical protein ACFLWC_06300 [Chloroflexota bacterium]
MTTPKVDVVEPFAGDMIFIDGAGVLLGVGGIFDSVSGTGWSGSVGGG